MLQKNKNNKKVALSLICSRRSFLLCQMKSVTYTRFTQGCSTSRALFPLERGICCLCHPVPAGGDAEGAPCCSRSSQHSPQGQAAPRHPLQIQQNPPSPPVPFPGISRDLFLATPAVILPLLLRTGPFPEPLQVLQFKHLLVGTLCHGLLFTAIKLR